MGGQPFALLVFTMVQLDDTNASESVAGHEDVLHAPLDRYQRIVVPETELAPLSRDEALSRIEAQRRLDVRLSRQGETSESL